MNITEFKGSRFEYTRSHSKTVRVYDYSIESGNYYPFFEMILKDMNNHDYSYSPFYTSEFSSDLCYGTSGHGFINMNESLEFIEDYIIRIEDEVVKSYGSEYYNTLKLQVLALINNYKNNL